MDNNFYKQLIEESQTGYAYQKIICDEQGNPVDFEFIEINSAFEALTGFKGKDVIGKRITEIAPAITEKLMERIRAYGEVAISGVSKDIEYFSYIFNRFYRVNTFSPEKYYFVCLFNDVSNEKRHSEEIEMLIEVSEKFLQINVEEIDYQKITDEFLNICGAKYALFNLFDENGKSFRTMAFSGEKGIIKKDSNILGIKSESNKWEYDFSRADKIKGTIITRFKLLKDIIDYSIPKSIAVLLEKNTNIGEVILIKILKNNIMLGDFTLIMEKDKSFCKENIAQIYTRQFGALIDRKRIKDALLDAEWKFKALFEKGPIGVAYHSMVYDKVGNPIDYYFIDANKTYKKLTGVNPIGKMATEAFPGIENDPFDWIGTFGKVAKTG